jgi:hypothetical protein
MNVVVLRGKLSREPEERMLESGSRLVRYEVTIRGDDGPAETSPVVWLDAPRTAIDMTMGEEVVVVGRVRRRWFKRGPVSESRVEVAARRVVPSRQRKKVDTVISEAVAVLCGEEVAVEE